MSDDKPEFGTVVLINDSVGAFRLCAASAQAS
jgi:hypothetical protein